MQKTTNSQGKDKNEKLIEETAFKKRNKFGKVFVEY